MKRTSGRDLLGRGVWLLEGRRRVVVGVGHKFFQRLGLWKVTVEVGEVLMILRGPAR
jgi:hypothetical protein